MFGYDFVNEARAERVEIGTFALGHAVAAENRDDLDQTMTLENVYDYDDDDWIRCHENVDVLFAVRDAIYLVLSVGCLHDLMTSIDSIYWQWLWNCVHSLFRVANAPTQNRQLVYIHVHTPKSCHNSIYLMYVGGWGRNYKLNVRQIKLILKLNILNRKRWKKTKNESFENKNKNIHLPDGHSHISLRHDSK